MSVFFTMAAFALALNIDAVAAGVAYGVRGIRVPLSSILIISGMSVAAIALSMSAGGMLAGFISTDAAHRIGGLVLLAIGLWILYQSLSNKKDRHESGGKEELLPQTVFQVRIKNMGIVIKILREPHRADLDSSGMISSGEAILLGAALAMDSLGAGFAVSLLGFNILTTAVVVGLGHIIMTYLGLYLGRMAGATSFCRHVVTLPGCILIALGLYKIY
ncbi:MAG: sporulation protein [Peptococcaceae bacterium BICA1-7]|nr:MAG: sporulation protein [Peptococcaceae bacterium BICA1-7]HBV97268.1 sporulation membrane protein YtaF [Desulfotomaculum sp.]